MNTAKTNNSILSNVLVSAYFPYSTIQQKNSHQFLTCSDYASCTRLTDPLPTAILPNMNAKYWIEKLALLPHPEGGSYREVYRSNEICPAQGLSARFGADRAFSTAIYFLLPLGEFSAFHRIKSDELWHHYDGGDLEIIVIHPNGKLQSLILGKKSPDATPIHIVPHGSWFAARPLPGYDDYVLCGCTVSPGFDFADFEMAASDELASCFPQYADLILQLTR